MNEMTINNNALMQKSLNASLIESYVAYIDRAAKTVKSYIKNLRAFFAYLAYKEIKQPQRQDIINYRDYLLAEHKALKLTAAGWAYQKTKKGEIKTKICKASTVKAYLQTVKSFFKWLSFTGLYADIAQNVHAPKVNNAVHKKDALTADDVRKIESSIENQATKAQAKATGKDAKGKAQRAEAQAKRLKAMYLLAVNAGLRTIELARANISDVVYNGKQAYIYIYGKGHTEADQKKALAKEVYQAIADYLNTRKDASEKEPLFIATGNRSKGKRIASTTISTMLKKAMQEAGYNSDRLTAHSLRHTTATAIQAIENNIYTTQKYMRHASPSTTEIYLHDEEAEREAETAEKLFNFYHSSKQESENLEELMKKLSGEKIEQLYKIALTMF